VIGSIISFYATQDNTLCGCKRPPSKTIGRTPS
jgi:hypothetical protein